MSLTLLVKRVRGGRTIGSLMITLQEAGSSKGENPFQGFAPDLAIDPAANSETVETVPDPNNTRSPQAEAWGE